MKGIVYKSTGSWYTVKGNDGNFYQCRIKGKFRIKDIISTNPIAVGDRVIFNKENISDTKSKGIISEILNRDNYIIRKSVNLSKQTHIIAANIDQVFLIITLKYPETSTTFIDRFLVAAQSYNIPCILLFNKTDIYTPNELLSVNNLIEIYESIGYQCIKTSALNAQTLKKIKTLMSGKYSLFSGHSGVGKSTLINAIDPSLSLKTKAISEAHAQGQHTTTFAEIFDLKNNISVIDTPGIKGFGIVNINQNELGGYFREFFKLKHLCKFNNCLHLQEPNCAVLKALKSGAIYNSRYTSYIQIMNENEEYYRKDIYIE